MALCNRRTPFSSVAWMRHASRPHDDTPYCNNWRARFGSTSCIWAFCNCCMGTTDLSAPARPFVLILLPHLAFAMELGHRMVLIPAEPRGSQLVWQIQDHCRYSLGYLVSVPARAAKNERLALCTSGYVGAHLQLILNPLPNLRRVLILPHHEYQAAGCAGKVHKVFPVGFRSLMKPLSPPSTRRACSPHE